MTKGRIEDLAGSLSQMSGVDDEAIQSGENLLLTFKSIQNQVGKNNDIFNQATKAALDMSVAFHQDLDRSAIQLGKALEDPIKGVTALRRVGISFTADQVKLIKSLEDTGHHLEAQKLVLAEVNRQVAGSAAAYGETLPGQLSKARNAFDEVAAKLAEKLIPGLTGVLQLVNEHWPEINAVFEATGRILAGAFDVANNAVSTFISTVRGLIPSLQQISSISLNAAISSWGQSAAVTAISFLALQKGLQVAYTAALNLMTAPLGTALASLLNPVTLVAAGLAIFAGLLYKSKLDADNAAASYDRARAALEGLNDAANESVHAYQRLTDANINLKQASLNVATALRERNRLEADGKKGTDEYKQAQLNVQAAYSARSRAELEVRDSQDAVTSATKKGWQELQKLRKEGDNVDESFKHVRGGLLGLVLPFQVVDSDVKGYIRNMESLANRADKVAAAHQKTNPHLAAAAQKFADNARAAADYAKRTNEIPGSLEKVATKAGGAGKSVGEAFGGGIAKGIAVSSPGVQAAAKQVVSDAEVAARAAAQAKSPSLLFAALGGDLTLGLAKGVQEKQAVAAKAAYDAAKKALDAAKQAVVDSKGIFASAFDDLVSTALAAFDKLSQDFETKTEKKIRKQDEARAARDRADALASAQKGLAEAQVSGDPQAILDAQKAVNDALFEIQRAADEKRAAQERKARDDSRELQRRHFEEQLGTLESQLERGNITASQFRKRLLNLFDKFDVPFRSAGKALGSALAEGLHDSFADAAKAARRLIEAIADEIAKAKFVVNVNVHVTGGSNPEHRQHGGPVRAHQTVIVGEAGPEMFTPNTSGRITPGVAFAGGGMAEIRVPVYIDSVQITEVVRREMLRFSKRNGRSAV